MAHIKDFGPKYFLKGLLDSIYFDIERWLENNDLANLHAIWKRYFRFYRPYLESKEWDREMTFETTRHGQFVDVFRKAGTIHIRNRRRNETIVMIPYAPNHGFMTSFYGSDGLLKWRMHLSFDNIKNLGEGRQESKTG